MSTPLRSPLMGHLASEVSDDRSRRRTVQYSLHVGNL